MVYTYLGNNIYRVTLASGKEMELTKDELEELGDLSVSIHRREQREKHEEVN